jgi:UDP-N-acetyl-2-amino-2-deoxyglucuronate dehydrogenase
MLGFAIVGCGLIARFHARAIADVPGARLVALVSRRCETGRKMAEELGLQVEVLTDLESALRREDIQVVCITTPSGVHMEGAVAAAAPS